MFEQIGMDSKAIEISIKSVVNHYSGPRAKDNFVNIENGGKKKKEKEGRFEVKFVCCQ
ncbi:MAG: hypothetical protein HQK52_01620 [Oligoflexia bacterium]|nr:hypothetical protein [Oligoflexia bacterium]